MLLKKRETFHLQIKREYKDRIFSQIRNDLLHLNLSKDKSSSFKICYEFINKRMSLNCLLSWVNTNPDNFLELAHQLIDLGCIGGLMREYKVDFLPIIKETINLKNKQYLSELVDQGVCEYLIDIMGKNGNWTYSQNKTQIYCLNRTLPYKQKIDKISSYQLLFDMLLFTQTNQEVMELYGYLLRFNIYKNNYSCEAVEYFTQLTKNVEYQPQTSHIQVIFNSKFQRRDLKNILYWISVQNQRNKIIIINHFLYQFSWIYYQDIEEIITKTIIKYLLCSNYPSSLRKLCLKILTNIFINQNCQQQIGQKILQSLGHQQLSKFTYNIDLRQQVAHLIYYLSTGYQILPILLNSIKYLLKDHIILPKKIKKRFALLVVLFKTNSSEIQQELQLSQIYQEGQNIFYQTNQLSKDQDNQDD